MQVHSIFYSMSENKSNLIVFHPHLLDPNSESLFFNISLPFFLLIMVPHGEWELTSHIFPLEPENMSSCGCYSLPGGTVLI